MPAIPDASSTAERVFIFYFSKSYSATAAYALIHPIVHHVASAAAASKLIVDLLSGKTETPSRHFQGVAALAKTLAAAVDPLTGLCGAARAVHQSIATRDAARKIKEEKQNCGRAGLAAYRRATREALLGAMKKSAHAAARGAEWVHRHQKTWASAAASVPIISTNTIDNLTRDAKCLARAAADFLNSTVPRPPPGSPPACALRSSAGGQSRKCGVDVDENRTIQPSEFLSQIQMAFALRLGSTHSPWFDSHNRMSIRCPVAARWNAQTASFGAREEQAKRRWIAMACKYERERRVFYAKITGLSEGPDDVLSRTLNRVCEAVGMGSGACCQLLRSLSDIFYASSASNHVTVPNGVEITRTDVVMARMLHVDMPGGVGAPSRRMVRLHRASISVNSFLSSTLIGSSTTATNPSPALYYLTVSFVNHASWVAASFWVRPRAARVMSSGSGWSLDVRGGVLVLIVHTSSHADAEAWVAALKDAGDATQEAENLASAAVKSRTENKKSAPVATPALLVAGAVPGGDPALRLSAWHCVAPAEILFSLSQAAEMDWAAAEAEQRARMRMTFDRGMRLAMAHASAAGALAMVATAHHSADATENKSAEKLNLRELIRAGADLGVCSEEAVSSCPPPVRRVARAVALARRALRLVRPRRRVWSMSMGFLSSDGLSDLKAFFKALRNLLNLAGDAVTRDSRDDMLTRAAGASCKRASQLIGRKIISRWAWLVDESEKALVAPAAVAPSTPCAILEKDLRTFLGDHSRAVEAIEADENVKREMKRLASGRAFHVEIFRYYPVSQEWRGCGYDAGTPPSCVTPPLGARWTGPWQSACQSDQKSKVADGPFHDEDAIRGQNRRVWERPWASMQTPRLTPAALVRRRRAVVAQQARKAAGKTAEIRRCCGDLAALVCARSLAPPLPEAYMSISALFTGWQRGGVRSDDDSAIEALHRVCMALEQALVAAAGRVGEAQVDGFDYPCAPAAEELYGLVATVEMERVAKVMSAIEANYLGRKNKSRKRSGSDGEADASDMESGRRLLSRLRSALHSRVEVLMTPPAPDDCGRITDVLSAMRGPAAALSSTVEAASRVGQMMGLTTGVHVAWLPMELETLFQARCVELLSVYVDMNREECGRGLDYNQRRLGRRRSKSFSAPADILHVVGFFCRTNGLTAPLNKVNIFSATVKRLVGRYAKIAKHGLHLRLVGALGGKSRKVFRKVFMFSPEKKIPGENINEAGVRRFFAVLADHVDAWRSTGLTGWPLATLVQDLLTPSVQALLAAPLHAALGSGGGSQLNNEVVVSNANVLSVADSCLAALRTKLASTAAVGSHHTLLRSASVALRGASSCVDAALVRAVLRPARRDLANLFTNERAGQLTVPSRALTSALTASRAAASRIQHELKNPRRFSRVIFGALRALSRAYLVRFLAVYGSTGGGDAAFWSQHRGLPPFRADSKALASWARVVSFGQDATERELETSSPTGITDLAIVGRLLTARVDAIQETFPPFLAVFVDLTGVPRWPCATASQGGHYGSHSLTALLALRSDVSPAQRQRLLVLYAAYLGQNPST